MFTVDSVISAGPGQDPVPEEGRQGQQGGGGQARQPGQHHWTDHKIEPLQHGLVKQFPQHLTLGTLNLDSEVSI